MTETSQNVENISEVFSFFCKWSFKVSLENEKKNNWDAKNLKIQIWSKNILETKWNTLSS